MFKVGDAVRVKLDGMFGMRKGTLGIIIDDGYGVTHVHWRSPAGVRYAPSRYVEIADYDPSRCVEIANYAPSRYIEIANPDTLNKRERVWLVTQKLRMAARGDHV